MMRGMPKTMSALIALSILTIAGVASASSTVEQGGRIQAVLDSASPGETIEVESGTYRESLVIDKPLVLKGVDSGGGAPIVETDTGSAITLRADGIVLENISARSTSSWTGDAGILVLSNSCVIRGCMASGNGNIGIMLLEATDCRLSGDVAEGNSREGIYLKNSSSNLLEGNLLKGNRYGLKLSASNENWILYNNISENRYEGIYLQESHRNTIKGNRAEGNDGALVMEGCRDNIVARNDFLGNDKGISLSDFRSSGSRPEGEGVLISYSIMPSEDLVSSNNTIYLNNLSNRVNARDDSLNAWDDGRIGNNYSDFNDPSEGCTGKRICDSEHSIPGGPSVDRYPQAAPLRIPGRLSGPGGAVLQLFQSSFLPGSEIVLNFTAPASYEVWAGIRPGDAGSDLYLGRNVTGDLAFSAPELEGSYTLVMHDMNGTQVMAIPFNVTIPTISAAPGSLLTCERIYVAFRGAPGQKDSWIGMYRAGSTELVSRQSLEGREIGNITFSSTEAGTFDFRLFAEGGDLPLASSSSVEVKATSGHRVIAEPSRVPPGGTVTVTFWGAPPEGTGVIGMYGMTRPDKFHIEKRGIGARTCGSMTFRLPKAPGQYDFRMFRDDITRQLLAQSNVVTVA